MTSQEALEGKIALAFDSVLSSKGSRVIELFNFLWPSKDFLVVTYKMSGGSAVIIHIMSKDEKTGYGILTFEPKITGSGRERVMSGYDMKVTYSSFSGAVEEATERLQVLSLLASTAKKMSEVPLIVKGDK